QVHRRARAGRGAVLRARSLLHGYLLGGGRVRDADGGGGLGGAHLPHRPGQRDRQSDRAGDQALRQPAHRTHHVRAHRPRRVGHPAARADARHGRRRADRHGDPHRQRPPHRRRDARPPRVRHDQALPQRVTVVPELRAGPRACPEGQRTSGTQNERAGAPAPRAPGSGRDGKRMKITRIREATAPIASDIRNAFITFSSMTISLVAVETDVVRDGGPVIGYGFTSNGRYAQGGILRERFIPRVLAADPAALIDKESDNLDPFAIWKAFMANEKPGGHGDRAHAAGALDMAVWDAVAKIAGKPLWRLLAERCNGGRFDEKVLVYPGGGYYYPGKELDGLEAEMRGYQAQGYRVVKMKIGGADLATDLARIEAVMKVAGGGANVAVDANGRFDLDTALAYGRAIEGYGLFWFEEPGDPLDYRLNAVLAEHYKGALATGENLFSAIDGRNLLRYGGMRPDRDWVQIDPALAYGLTEYLRFLDVAAELGWSRRRLIPHGGHQLALNMAAGLQLGGSESYPGVFQPYGGFADRIPIVDGYVRLPEEPGIGMELKPRMFA